LPAQPGTALGRGPALPDSVRKALMADATKTLVHELTVVQDGESSASLTIAQRVLWQKSFHSAREYGLSLRDAQEVALRGAADGRVYGPAAFKDMTGEDQKERRITCLACQYEVPSREELAEHYSCDWHAVNAVRKSASVAPLSLRYFEHRRDSLLAAEQHEIDGKTAAASFDDAMRTKRMAERRSGKLACDISRLEAYNEESADALAKSLLAKKAAADSLILQASATLGLVPKPLPSDEAEDGDGPAETEALRAMQREAERMSAKLEGAPERHSHR